MGGARHKGDDLFTSRHELSCQGLNDRRLFLRRLGCVSASAVDGVVLMGVRGTCMEE